MRPLYHSGARASEEPPIIGRRSRAPDRMPTPILLLENQFSLPKTRCGAGFRPEEGTSE